ncbi:cupin domain-containing protein [Maribacter sp. 2210JD10-5]|uniref:cupin domain-containing protein n=1 Tax=Maribacter sp. 2210JD10-5 TaxID=3386272 RepID=UPI0039BC48D7
MLKKNYTLQKSPLIVPTADGKRIAEHFGLATDGNPDISIAHMIAPPGWSEPFQTPEFDEYTLVVRGKKQFMVEGKKIVVRAGESIKIERNTRVQYSNPFDETCEYIAICTPAFSIEKVNRED